MKINMILVIKNDIPHLYQLTQMYLYLSKPTKNHHFYFQKNLRNLGLYYLVNQIIINKVFCFKNV